MANKELMVTLGLDASSYAQNIKRAKDLNKELDSSFKLMASSSEKFESSINGLGKKQDYLSQKIKIASGLTEVYAKRIKESQDALEDAQADMAHYAVKVENLSKALKVVEKDLGKNSSAYESIAKKLKENTQLYDKSEKAVNTYNKRLTEAKVGYKETQASIQGFNREITFTAEKLSALRVDNSMKNLKNQIGDLDHKFSLVKNSVSDFDSSMEGLQKTQEFLNDKTKLSKKLLQECSEEMANSAKKVDYYEQELREVGKELEEWDNILNEMKGNEPDYEQIRSEVEALRNEYTQINGILNFHQDRVESLGAQYKSTESSIASLAGSLDSTSKKMQSMNDKVTFEPVSKQVKELTNGTLQKLEKELDEIEEEFKVLTASAKEYESTTAGLELKQTMFNKTLKVTQQSFNAYSKELTEVKSKTKELTNQQAKLENEIESKIANLRNLSGAEWDKEAKAIDALKKKYADVNKDLKLHSSRLKEVQSGYKASKLKVAELSRELEDTSVNMSKISRQKIFDNLDNQIKKITSEIKVLDSRFKASASTIKNFTKTKKGLAEQTEVNKEKFILLKKQLEVLNTTLDKNGKELRNLKEKQQQVGESVNALRLKMLKMEKDSPEYREALASLSRLEDSYEKVTKEVRDFEQANNRVQAEINETTADINNLARETNELSRTFNANKWKDAGTRFKNIGGAVQQVGQSFLGLSLAIGGAQGVMFKTGVDFTTSMSKVRAVMSATDAQFAQLTDRAREMARETVYSASECAEALQYLGLAGYNAEQAMRSLPHILNLAMAGAMDLSEASDLATDAIASLGFVGDDAVNALPDFLDRVAQAGARSNTSITQMLEAYIKVGGQFDKMNIDLDTSATMLGIIANRGLKAEEAGTSLNSILINLTQATGQSAKAMKELGVSAFDSEGNIRNIEDVMIDLARALKNMGTEQAEIQLTNMLGGKTQAKAIQKLFQGMISDTGELSDEYKKLKAEISSAPDLNALANMGEIMTDNLGGDLKILKSQIEESFLTIFDELEPRLRKFIQTLTKGVEKFTNWFVGLDDWQQNLVLGFATFMAIAPPVLMMIGAMSTGIGAICDLFGLLVGLMPIAKTQTGELVAETVKADGALKKLTKNMKGITNNIPKMASGMKTFGGTIASFFGGLVTNIGGWLAGLGTAIGSSTIWATLSSAFSTLAGWITTAFGAVFSAAGLKVVAICALIAGALYLVIKAIKYLYQNWDSIVSKMSELWSKLGDSIGKGCDWIKEKTHSLVDGIKDKWASLKDFWSELMTSIGDAVKKGIEKIGDFIMNFPTYFKKFIAFLGNKMIETLGVIIGSIIGTIVALGKQIFDTLKLTFTSLGGVFEILKGIFTLNFESIKSGVMTIIKGLGTFLKNSLNTVWNVISGILINIAGLFGINLKGIRDSIEKWASETWSSFKTWLDTTAKAMAEWCSQRWANFKTWLSNLGKSISEWCSTTWNNFLTWLSNTGKSISEWCSTTITNFKTWLQNLGKSALEWSVKAVAGVTLWFSNLGKKIDEWWNTTWANFTTWLKNLYNKFTEWCSNMLNKLTSWLKAFAEDPIGQMKKFATNILNGLRDAKNKFFNWCEEMTNKLKTWFANWIAETKNKVAEWADKFREGVEKIKGFFSELPSKLYNIGKDMISNLWNGFMSKLDSFASSVKNSISNITDGIFSKRSLDAQVDAQVSYQGDIPSPLAEGFNIQPMARANSFATIGSTIGSMIEKSISLDNYKTNGGFYKPESMRVSTTSEESSSSKLLNALMEQNQLLMQLLTAERPINVGVNVDGRNIAKASARYMEAEISSLAFKKQRLGGVF